MDLERFIGRSLLRMIDEGQNDPALADDFDRSAQLLAEEGARMLPGIGCQITILSATAPRRVCVSAAGGGDVARRRGTEWPAERTPTGWTLESAAAVERIVGEGDPTVAPQLLDGPATTIRVVPLSGPNRATLGAYVVQRAGGDPFTGPEREAIDAYASLIGVALLRTRAFAEARSSALEMSSLVDLVVHELRSPLTVMAGYLDLILAQGTDVDPIREKAIGIVSSKVAEMQRLVDELALSARLAGGPVLPAAVPVDLGAAVVKAVERAEPRARILDARLSADVPASLMTAACDPAHLDHILDNLINNALSYGGPRPDVTVSVDIEVPRVVVVDRGPGISADLHDRVFDRFFRINPLVGHAGSGLGLFISRRLAEQAGGSLVIDYSEPGKGSRFALSLLAAA